MGITGAVLMASGTLVSANAQAQAGRFNQRVANQNAGIAELQAIDAERRGVEDESALRTRISAAIGTARASYASQGIAVDSGSALEAQASIAYMGEKDVITLRNNAAREAWGYRVQAVDLRNQGRIARYTGNMQAFGTVLSSAGKMAGGIK